MNWKSKENKELVEAILSLENFDEATAFLRDLLTESEIKEFALRLKVAKMLSENVPYLTIENETGFSSTTVARVSKWLKTGMGGYTNIINKLHHNSLNQTGRGLHS